MTILEALRTLVLGPIELLLDTLFALSMQVVENPGIAIVFLSLAVNLLILPLYLRADKIQMEERDTAARLKPGIDLIKANFTGDERFMILQAFYRENHYKPWYVLRSSVSLLLQIPFFIAAYSFLSGLHTLQGVTFGPILDLGAPDGLLQIRGRDLNLLPILMTLINILSGMVYTRGMPLKSKIQLYGMALLFLVLLYKSPSGLVLYWTLNNLFSLVKNLVYKLVPKKKNPEEEKAPVRKKAVSKLLPKTGRLIFLSSCLLLAILTGLVIPSSVLEASPGEFTSLQHFEHPARYLFHPALLAAGTFLIWCVVFYSLASPKGKKRYQVVFSVAAFAAAIDFMFFGKGYGNMSSLLQYNAGLSVDASSVLLNLLCLAALAAVVLLLWRWKPAVLQAACLAGCLAAAVLSVTQISSINAKTVPIQEAAKRYSDSNEISIPLSKSGKNVVVMMLDRAVSGFVPFILNEKPELMDQFSGFTYYPNTTSFGVHTNIGSPPLFGGYEYTPDAMAARADELLKDKHNEALMVMPVNFLENGSEVTVFDVPYGNYLWDSDLSIYDKYPAIHKAHIMGTLQSELEYEKSRVTTEIARTRNLFCYSLLRSAPVALHPLLYADGLYNRTDAIFAPWAEDSFGIMTPEFLASYRALENLPAVTEISENGPDTFLMMANDITHDVQELQEPDYVPEPGLDNDAYEAEHQSRWAADGSELPIYTANEYVYAHYQSNMAAFLLLGKWFDFLRENGVYDNTRIILVSDHAFATGFFGFNLLEGKDASKYADTEIETWSRTETFNALLMVKDFGASGAPVTDNAFMTNADTPVLAFAGMVENPVNPATGLPVTGEAKNAGELHLIESDYRVDVNNGTVFADPVHITLKNQDIFEKTNWILEN